MPVTGLLQVMCTRSDGAQVTGTLNFDPASGNITSGQVINTSTQQVAMIVTVGGVDRQVQAPPGTTDFTAQQIAQAGFTNISQVQNFTVTCV